MITPPLISGKEEEGLSRELRIRKAALLSLCDPDPERWVEEFTALSRSQWKRLLRWMHLSGLALSFIHRAVELRFAELLPGWVTSQLLQDLRDNRHRTQGMVAESIAIQREFQRAGLPYAGLKGISLWPCSVPKPELRLQFDLDFLLAADGMDSARQILETRGYRVYESCAVRSHYRFKRNEKPGLTLKHIYRNTGSWVVELHGASSASRRPLLDRLEWREIDGFNMPVLAPIDLFLGQAMHAYKDLCGPFPRASLLLEFRRHVLFRQDDDEFWKELFARIEDDPQTQIGLGIVTLLICGVMGTFAPEELMAKTAERVPRLAELWCRHYGARVALGSHPGSKLFLFLRQALGMPVDPASAGRSMRQVLLPLQLPPPPIRGWAQETMSVRLGRYRMHLALLFERLRFHIVEGLRYWWEWRQWRQMIRSAQ